MAVEFDSDQVTAVRIRKGDGLQEFHYPVEAPPDKVRPTRGSDSASERQLGDRVSGTFWRTLSDVRRGNGQVHPCHVPIVCQLPAFGF